MYLKGFFVLRQCCNFKKYNANETKNEFKNLTPKNYEHNKVFPKNISVIRKDK